jgi:hypothetical protein
MEIITFPTTTPEGRAAAYEFFHRLTNPHATKRHTLILIDEQRDRLRAALTAPPAAPAYLGTNPAMRRALGEIDAMRPRVIRDICRRLRGVRRRLHRANDEIADRERELVNYRAAVARCHSSERVG